jgi:hypothetical protein
MNITELLPHFSEISFVESSRFSWSPETSTIQYDARVLARPDGACRLLHEIAHAKLGHKQYRYDIQLLRLEVEAWRYATALGKQYGQRVSKKTCNRHLETYRNWLYLRSLCPTCGSTGLQDVDLVYGCLRCRTTWQVPPTQLCRVRRRIATLPTPV